MIASFDVRITFGQIVVSWPDIPTYFVWTDAHFAQGFAWSPVGVAFGICKNGSLCRVEVDRCPDMAFDVTEAIWAIQVLFKVPPDGLFTVGGIDEPTALETQAGPYSLVFAAFAGAAPGAEYALRLLLVFRPDTKADFAILKAGDALTTNVVLRKDADSI